MNTNLNEHDFMMMDVHRPLTDEEIAETNPQAALDKTLEPEQDEVGADESMDSPSARCETCFAPMPCADHANVEHLNTVTTEDIDPVTVLADAHNKGMSEVVIVGFDRYGNEYFASSVADGALSMYHLQRGIYRLNKVMDQEEEDRRVPPAA